MRLTRNICYSPIKRVILLLHFCYSAAKKNVNVGKGGGTAGLDDYIYDDAADDGYDFM
jgi:hypothetical protein